MSDSHEVVHRYGPQSIAKQLLHQVRKLERSAIPLSKSEHSSRCPLALRSIHPGLRRNHWKVTGTGSSRCSVYLYLPQSSGEPYYHYAACKLSSTSPRRQHLLMKPVSGTGLQGRGSFISRGSRFLSQGICLPMYQRRL